MTPLRTTLVGCGAAAQKLYAKPLRALERQGVLRVTALVDRQAAHASALRGSFPRATLHDDLGRALAPREADLTLILSPVPLHAEQAILALRHGSHVLCEKPMAATVERSDAMIAEARRARRVLAIGMVRRFFPAFARLRTLVAGGELGEIRSFTYREGRLFDWDVKTPAGFTRHPEGGAGLLYDIGSHVFDYLHSVFGPLEVISYADDALGGGVEGNILMQVDSPLAPGSIRLSWDSPMKNELRVVGSRGEAVLRLDEFDRLAVGAGSRFAELKIDHAFPADVHEPTRRRISPRLYTEGIHCQLIQVARAIALGEPPAVDGEGGREAVRAIESARRLARPIDMPWLDEGQGATYRDLHWSGGAMMGTIAIIGAAGFVGTRLVESLVLDGHRDVRAVVRAYRSMAGLARLGPALSVRLADAEDAASLAPALRGASVVVNLTTGAPAGILRSTRSLLEACEAAGVGRLIHLSSAVVYKGVDSPDLDDDAPPATGHWMPYARAKSAAEVMLRGRLAAGRRQVVVLRPGIVWGVRSPHTKGTVDALLEKRAYLVGDGHGVFNSIYIDNMVACIRACCDHPDDIRGFYHVGDDEYVTWRDFHSALAGPLGYDMARMPTVSAERMPWSGRAAFEYGQSLPALNGLYHWLKARAPDAVKARIKRRLSGPYDYATKAADYAARPPVDRETWHLQKVRHKLPTAKFAARFGFKPPVSFEDGIRRTILWVRSIDPEPSRIAAPTEP